MSTLLISNVRLVRPGKTTEAGSLLVRDGRIAGLWTGGGPPSVPASDLTGEASTPEGGQDAARPPEEESPPDTPTLDGRGGLLTPGLIDVHTHGIGRFCYEGGAEALVSAARELGRFGVTTVVPTLVPRPGKAGYLAVDGAAAALDMARGVHLPGLHLEGPFVALGGAACATEAGDLDLLEALLDAANRRVSIMSVSPETPGILPVIERLRERGIRPFITHTRATVEQTLAALDAGATHATHFYDVFPSPPETDPGVRPVGVVETMLADRRATVDFIADGVHVHPMAIRAAVAAKGWRGVTLITDSNVGAGLPPGIHDTPWGYAVRVREGDGARHAEQGFLAGSTLTMNRGMANLLRWLELPPAQVWAMGTLNPANLLGLANKGRLEVGADADLVLWNDGLEPVRTWLRGECVYEKA